MTARDAAEAAVAPLRDVPGILRTAVIGADGNAIIDDKVLREREEAAAVGASLAGLAEVVAEAFGVGDSRGAVVFGAAGAVFVRPAGAGVAVAAVADPHADLTSVYAALGEAAARLRDA